jgi:hypothetical protein
MRAAIIQSNYMPWKGYFDLIHAVDVFVFLEDVQYTKFDWRNRNKIKTSTGLKWITVPVKGGIQNKIFEIKINNSIDWSEKQKRQITANYSRTSYFHSYRDDIFEIFSRRFETLSELNISAIMRIAGLLGIETKFLNSMDIQSSGRKEDKLIDICHRIEADVYVSGPSAKRYINENKFLTSSITLLYHDYSGYPEYPQLWGGFNHNVSIIDLLFNCGEESAYYIWGWRDGK